MILIGLTGQMGVGKSTAIKLLEKILVRNAQVVKFAQPLYDMQEYIYGRIESTYKRPVSFIKDRTLLQWLGTDWGRRTIHQDIWIDLWKNTVKAYPASLVICDDVRFDNEANAVLKEGGILLKITSDKNTARIDTTTGIAKHASEAGVTPTLITELVENNGTLEEFERALRLAIFSSMDLLLDLTPTSRYVENK